MKITVRFKNGKNFEYAILNSFDIISIGHIENYSIIKLTEAAKNKFGVEEIMFKKSFKELISEIKHHGFMRVHNSHIVNKNNIKKLNINCYQSSITMINDEVIPVSRRNRKYVISEVL